MKYITSILGLGLGLLAYPISAFWGVLILVGSLTAIPIQMVNYKSSVTVRDSVRKVNDMANSIGTKGIDASYWEQEVERAKEPSRNTYIVILIILCFWICVLTLYHLGLLGIWQVREDAAG